MTTQLQCTKCNEMFEVSSPTAEAMHRWRAQSGEPFICGKCAGVDGIYEQEIQEAATDASKASRYRRYCK